MNRRTDAQNRELHRLIGKLAKAWTVSPDVAKRLIVRLHGSLLLNEKRQPVTVHVPYGITPETIYPYLRSVNSSAEDSRYAYRDFVVVKRTHDLTVEEFKKLLDRVREECLKAGVNPDAV